MSLTKHVRREQASNQPRWQHCQQGLHVTDSARENSVIDAFICVKKSLEFSHFWAMLLALDKCFHVQLHYPEVSRIAVCDHIPQK